MPAAAARPLAAAAAPPLVVVFAKAPSDAPPALGIPAAAGDGDGWWRGDGARAPS